MRPCWKEKAFSLKRGERSSKSMFLAECLPRVQFLHLPLIINTSFSLSESGGLVDAIFPRIPILILPAPLAVPSCALSELFFSRWDKNPASQILMRSR
jgi:hypothetical protein